MTDHRLYRYMTPEDMPKRVRKPGTERATWKGGREGRKQIRINPALEARMTAWLQEQGMTWADWVEREALRALDNRKE